VAVVFTRLKPGADFWEFVLMFVSCLFPAKAWRWFLGVCFDVCFLLKPGAGFWEFVLMFVSC